MRLTTAGAWLALGVALAGCGHAAAPVATGPKTARPANPQAVSLMVKGVEMFKDPRTRPQALDFEQQAVAMDADLWEAHFDLGVMRAQMGDLAGAESELAKAESLAPDEEDVAVAAAEVRRRRGENKAAADGLSRFVQAHPQALEAKSRYAVSLRDAGQYDQAIAQGREVLLKKPADAAALADLALSYLAENKRDTADLLAKQAVAASTKGSPGAAAAQRATALIALAAGNDAEAFAAFTAASDADPTDTTAQLDSGVVLLRAGAYAKAADHFRAVLKVVPDDAGAKIGLATSLRGQADSAHPQGYEDARNLLGEVLTKDPHNVSALYDLGVLNADFLKKPDQAHPLFQRFLDDAPADHPSRGEAQKYLAATAGGAAPTAPAAAAPAPAGGK